MIAAILINVSGYSQSASDILKDYTRATGGQEAWDNVTSIKATGSAKLVSQNMELPFERILLADGRQITALTINGSRYVENAYDGRQLWGSNNEMQYARKTDEELHNFLISTKDFPYPTHNWIAKGFKARLLGKAQVNNRETYKIEIVKDPTIVEGVEIDNMVTYYIDVDRLVPILTETLVASGPYKGRTMQAYLTDYRDIDGYLYPFNTTMKYDGEIFQILKTDRVEVNGVIDNTIFDLPN